MIRRHLRLIPVSAVLLPMFLGFALLAGSSGCGGEDAGPALSEQNQQNIQDELNSTKAAQKKGKVGQP